jgi:sterol desaturase/sphingolipid hydroxylase (fatty acid hydroxylase superfamily)
MDAFIKPTVVAIPFFLVTFILEWWAVKAGKAKGRYETKDAVTSLSMGLGSVIVDTLLASIGVWVLMLFWPYRLFDVPVTWWSFLIIFVGYDLIYYWKHRFAHMIRFWWAEHHTHHSSEHYNLTTALRQPWFGPMTGQVIMSAPLVLLGFHPAFIAVSAGVNLVYQYWIHTEAIGRMPGWFEAVMNTPSHHRVHHATNPRYLDANFAGVFIIWDKMFGSFVPELDQRQAGLWHREADQHVQSNPRGLWRDRSSCCGIAGMTARARGAGLGGSSTSRAGRLMATTRDHRS